jgi:hypothetical protein
MTYQSLEMSCRATLILYVSETTPLVGRERAPSQRLYIRFVFSIKFSTACDAAVAAAAALVAASAIDVPAEAPLARMFQLFTLRPVMNCRVTCDRFAKRRRHNKIVVRFSLLTLYLESQRSRNEIIEV